MAADRVTPPSAATNRIEVMKKARLRSIRLRRLAQAARDIRGTEEF